MTKTPLLETLETIDGLDEFERLAERWDDLYQRSGAHNLFLTHAWLSNWARHFAPDSACAVIKRDGDQLVAGAFFDRCGDLTAMPEEHTYMPDVLCPLGAANPLAEVLATVGQTSRWMRLGGWSGTPHYRRELARACLAADLVAIVAASVEQRYIDTRASFDDYLATRKKSVRSELRRKHRRLQSEHADAELLLLRGPAAAEQSFAAIESVEVDTWKASAGSAIVSSAAERSFYRSVLEIDSADALAYTFVLNAGGEPIAYVTGVVHSGVYYTLKTSYRLRDAALAPGQVLFYRVLETLCGDASPVSCLELLGKDSRWKRELASGSETKVSYLLTRNDSLGRFQRLAKDVILPAVRRFVEQDERLARRWGQVKLLGRRALGMPKEQ